MKGERGRDKIGMGSGRERKGGWRKAGERNLRCSGQELGG